MKNKIKFFTALFLVLLLLCSCGAKEPLVENETTQPEQPKESITLPTNRVPTTYDKILKSLIAAFPWNKNEDYSVPNFPEFSSLYKRHPSLSEINVALIDLDENGQEELIITGVSTSFVYDIFTITNGQAVHLFSSEENNSYCLYENGYIENQWTYSVSLNGKDYYKLDNGTASFVGRITTDLFHAHGVGLVADTNTVPDDKILFKSNTTEGKDYIHILPSEVADVTNDFLNKSAPLQLEYYTLSGYLK